MSVFVSDEQSSDARPPAGCDSQLAPPRNVPHDASSLIFVDETATPTQLSILDAGTDVLCLIDDDLVPWWSPARRGGRGLVAARARGPSGRSATW
jgi:hypothetical protein